MQSELGKPFEIRDIGERLETLCFRVDNLENLISSYNNHNSELQVVTTEQPIDLVNNQEQQVNTFYFCLIK